MKDLNVGMKFTKKNKEKIKHFFVINQFWRRSLINNSCTKHTIILNEDNGRTSDKVEYIKDPEGQGRIYE